MLGLVRTFTSLSYVHRQCDMPSEPPGLDASEPEHDRGRLIGIRVAVLVGQKHDFRDAGLDNRLGALVAREQRRVDGAADKVRTVAVKYRVQLSVTDERILRLEWCSLSAPR